MKKMIFVLIFCFVGCFMTGCKTVAASCEIVRLEVYAEETVSKSTRLAIREIKDEITGIIRSDFDCLNEKKIVNFCECVLRSWHENLSVSVSLDKGNNIVMICFGENNFKLLSSSDIMLPFC